MLATAASLKGRQDYPSQQLYNAWTLLFLSMDRNSLWGSAGGMVFEHEKSWDVKDRLTWIEKQSAAVLQTATAKLLAAGDGAGLFNPLNWKRNDPFVCDGAVCQVGTLLRLASSAGRSLLHRCHEKSHFRQRSKPSTAS